MKFAPIARIALRYGVGYILGAGVGETLAMDPDVVNMVALGMGGAVEATYAMAVKKGWAK